MKIKWLGHACFLITTKGGIRIITDPYQSGAFGNAIRHEQVNMEADIVTVSHKHLDHGYIDNIRGDFVKLDKPGLFEIEGVLIEGLKTYHDPEGGRLRGENIIFKFFADGVSVCHFGDIGHIPDEMILKKIGEIDVALIPVGGTFTIDNGQASKIVELLNPKITVPMHYRSARCLLNIDTVDPFLEGKQGVEEISGSDYEIIDGDLRGKRILILSAAL